MYTPSQFCYVCFLPIRLTFRDRGHSFVTILRRIVDRMYSVTLLYSVRLASSTKTLVKFPLQERPWRDVFRSSLHNGYIDFKVRINLKLNDVRKIMQYESKLMCNFLFLIFPV